MRDTTGEPVKWNPIIEPGLACGCRGPGQCSLLPSVEAKLHAGGFPDDEIARLVCDMGPADGAGARVAARRKAHPERY